MSNELSDVKFLTWIAERLEHVYDEDHNVDFLHRLRKIIANYPDPAPLASELALAVEQTEITVREAGVRRLTTVIVDDLRTLLRAVRAQKPGLTEEQMEALRLCANPRIEGPTDGGNGILSWYRCPWCCVSVKDPNGHHSADCPASIIRAAFPGVGKEG